MEKLKIVLQFLMFLVKLFPKFFGNMLSFIPHVGIFIKFLPEFVSLLKSVHTMINNGITEAKIRQDMVRIDNVFASRAKSIKEAADKARELNDVFRN